MKKYFYINLIFSVLFVMNFVFGDENLQKMNQDGKKNLLKLDLNPKYRTSSSITGEFTQKNTNQLMNRTQISNGKLWILKPKRFRWETSSPEKSLLIVNEKQVIYYTYPLREGERGQVAIRKAVDSQSKLAVNLLSGGAELEKDFEIKLIEENQYELKPLKPAGDIKLIELYLDKDSHLVYKVRLKHSTGNSTEIELKNVKLGEQVSNQLFRFKIPKHTNIVE